MMVLAQTSELAAHRWGNSDFTSVVIRIVRDQLCQLNIYKSAGPDRVQPRVLKELADVIAGALSTIYWKLAKVIPIYRKSVREDPGNSRPASLNFSTWKNYREGFY